MIAVDLDDSRLELARKLGAEETFNAKQEGLAMQPGDLISLGSFSALLPPKAGLSVTATYDGLPGAAPVQLSFK